MSFYPHVSPFPRLSYMFVVYPGAALALVLVVVACVMHNCVLYRHVDTGLLVGYFQRKIMVVARSVRKLVDSFKISST